ncbi:hypothetical protein B0H12DRAFT_376238 [Mycena haematopus]|nr:hypothetical protein B0H12DRAFT_376238 [Mycena haematopus]
MPAGVRNPFTTDDDNLLIKYLAKHNPGIQGRSGNKVYQKLVQNEDNKWAWSSRHPWGGWRDRYTKDQPWFNRRIKEYQKKKGWPTENPHWINGTQKPKDSDAEEDSDIEAKAEAKHKRKQASSTDAGQRVNGTQQPKDSDADEDSGAPAKEVKRKRKRASSDARQRAKIAKRRKEDSVVKTEDELPTTEQANTGSRSSPHSHS